MNSHIYIGICTTVLWPIGLARISSNVELIPWLDGRPEDRFISYRNKNPKKLRVSRHEAFTIDVSYMGAYLWRRGNAFVCLRPTAVSGKNGGCKCKSGRPVLSREEVLHGGM